MQANKNTFIVERAVSPNKEQWYECMLSPFGTKEECLEYIEKYKQYYPLEYRNYRVSCISKV